MFQLRTAHVDAFDEAAFQRALADIQLHARKHFAALLKDVPDDRLARALRRIALDAKSRGLRAMGDTLLFVNLSLAYGEGFLERPELAWMAQLLDDATEISSAPQRLKRLYAEVLRRNRQ